MGVTVDFDIDKTWVTGAAFDKARAKIAEAFAYSPGYSPSQILLYPSDYKAIVGQLQRALNKASRARAAEAKRASGAKGRMSVDYDKVGAVTFRGIPVNMWYRQSRPRKFEA